MKRQKADGGSRIVAESGTSSSGHRLGIVALGILALTAGGCRRGNDASAAMAADSSVAIGPENMAVAERTELRSGPAISGSLEPEREATVRAEVSGPVVQAYADQGQSVARGALLARIDDTAIRDQFLSARSAVRSAESAAEIAAREADRAAKLLAAGAVAERDVEGANRASIAAQAQLADERARLTSAEKMLANTQVRAPFAGVVSERQVNAGDFVQPGGALFTVVDPASMRLEASVPADQLSQLRVGLPVEFSVNGYPGRAFVGRIDRINPTADPATRQVRIFAAIPNTGGHLVAGLFAEGRVATETRTTTVVPMAAVNQSGLRPSVVRLRGGRVEKADVQLGLRDQATERIEIRSGVLPGDTVLLGVAQGITLGTMVKVGRPGTSDTGQGERPGTRDTGQGTSDTPRDPGMRDRSQD